MYVNDHHQAVKYLNATLIIGRRTNIDMRRMRYKPLVTPSEVETVAARFGRVFRADAIDYFIIHRNHFPWSRIRNIAVGRPAYDNYIVGMALKHHVSVVDVSNTVFAVHQTCCGLDADDHRSPEDRLNFKAIGYFDYKIGHITNAQFYTDYIYKRSSTKEGVIIENDMCGSRCLKESIGLYSRKSGGRTGYVARSPAVQKTPPPTSAPATKEPL